MGGEGGDAVEEGEKERGNKKKEEKPVFISKWYVKAWLLPNNKEVGVFPSVADWIAD